MIKDTDEQPDKDNTRQSLEESQAWGLLSRGVEGVSLSLYRDMFTNLEDSRTPCFWNFYGGFIT